MVVFSYDNFASIFILKNDCTNNPCHVVSSLTPGQTILVIIAAIFYMLNSYALPIMIASFLLLRKSMSRVTSLPDEYLDERQIESRDWAFRTGYLVIRRVGLGLAAALLTLQILNTNFSTSVIVSPLAQDTRLKPFTDYLSSLTTENPLAFYFNVIASLAYVAYSFPLILLAWRESKFPEVIPQAAQPVVPAGAAKIARQYYRRLSLILFSFLGIVVLLVAGMRAPSLGSFALYSLLPLLFFVLIPYSMYVYVWSSIKTVQVLKAAKVDNYNQGKETFAAMFTLTFFVITQLLGVSLLVFFQNAFNGPLAFAGENWVLVTSVIGLAMIPAQALSVLFIPRLSVDK